MFAPLFNAPTANESWKNAGSVTVEHLDPEFPAATTTSLFNIIKKSYTPYNIKMLFYSCN